MTSNLKKDESHMELPESFVFNRYGPQTTDMLDASADYFTLIDVLLKETKEIRAFLLACRVAKNKKKNEKSLLSALRYFKERKRKDHPWNYFTLERYHQIENLVEEIALVLLLIKQRERLCARLRTQLEMKISLRDVEIERLRNELQQHSATQKKASQILMTKISDLHDFFASAKKYLDSLEDG